LFVLQFFNLKPYMRTIGRALAVFDCFSETSPDLSLQQIAAKLTLAKSTTFRLVQILEKSGYLVRLENLRYCLSHQFLRLSRITENSLTVIDVAKPKMSWLAKESGECVTLYGIEGRNQVCLASVKGANPIMGLNEPGDQFSLTLGAASLVLMAHSAQHTSSKTLASLAKHLKQPQKVLRTILSNAKKQGYAVSHGGSIAGISAVSAPIYDYRENVRYSINIVLPTARVRGRIEFLTRLLCIAGNNISVGLGSRALILERRLGNLP